MLFFCSFFCSWNYILCVLFVCCNCCCYYFFLMLWKLYCMFWLLWWICVWWIGLGSCWFLVCILWFLFYVFFDDDVWWWVWCLFVRFLVLLLEVCLLMCLWWLVDMFFCMCDVGRMCWVVCWWWLFCWCLMFLSVSCVWCLNVFYGLKLLKKDWCCMCVCWRIYVCLWWVWVRMNVVMKCVWV